jgi:hypothetical protein
MDLLDLNALQRENDNLYVYIQKIEIAILENIALALPPCLVSYSTSYNSYSFVLRKLISSGISLFDSEDILYI